MFMKLNLSKGKSIALVSLIYGVAAAAGLFVFTRIGPRVPELWAVFIADAVATAIVWAAGLVLGNVSVYDPYWSVFPPVMFLIWSVYKAEWSLPVILLLVAVWLWGTRLTLNWAITFKGLAYEDWRYTKYRITLSPALFHLTNFFGLNMMPTVLVFACMVPGFKIYESIHSAGIFTWLGFVICIASAVIQMVADRQIHRFRAENPGKFCDVGLWKKGRHPNYFGEIQFWWGIWLMYASLEGPDLLVIAPLAMTCLFLYISIPLMEQRQLENKPGYAEYRKRTRILI